MAAEVPSYQFDNVIVDVPAERVLREGVDIDLEPKAFAVLVLLLSRPGELLTKEDLLQGVWPGVFVTDNALARVVAQLRRALGDSARQARYIETVPTRGYRFVAHVQMFDGRPVPSRSPLLVPPGSHGAARPGPRATSGRHHYLSVLFGLIAIASLTVAWVAQRRVQVPAVVSAEAGPPLTRMQVTSSPSLDAFPAWSADGRWLAYASDRTGTFELQVRSMQESGQTRVVTSDGQGNVQPAWSPDGQWLAYHSVRQGGIWVVSAQGSTPRQLTTFGSRPVWSPDGRRLAFQSAPFSEPNAGAFEAFGPSSIWLVDASGGAPQQLTRPWEPEGGHVRPSWWLDGRHLLFASQGITTTRLYRVDAETGAVTLVHDVGARALDATLTSDGRMVYFVRMDEHFALWRVPLTEGWAVASPPTRVLPPGELDIRHVSVSADGRRLAYAAMSAVSGLRVQPVTDEGVPAGRSDRLAEDAVRAARRPAVSPDGTWVVFERTSAGQPPAIWLQPWSDARPTQLTPADMAAREPSWTASGDAVYFVSDHGDMDRIWTVDLATRQVRPVTTLGRTPSGLLRPRVSPDGRWLAYTTTAGGRLEVRVRAIDGGGDRTVARVGEGAAFPVWSSDGTHLAFDTWNDGVSQVYAVRRTGEGLTPLTRGVDQAWVRSWSPDDQRVAFAALDDGRWNVWWASRDGTRQQRVTDYTDEHHYVRNPVWSPRGDRLVYEFASVSGNVWVVELATPGT